MLGYRRGVSKVSRARQARARALWVVGLGWVGSLALGACRKGATEPHDQRTQVESPARAQVEMLELRFDAGGLDTAEVEQFVLTQVEAGLLEIPGLRHVTAEASAGRGRVRLELEPGNLDAAIEAARAQVDAVQPSLPASVGPPQILRVAQPGELLRFAVHGETVDPLTLLELHRRLVERIQMIAGVRAIETCVPERRIVIELEPQRLQAYGLDTLEIDRALREQLVQIPGAGAVELRLDALRSFVVAATAERTIMLGDLAGIRYGFGDPSCVAAASSGLAASATITVDGSESRAAVESAIEDARRELPPAVSLQRFGAADTVIELELQPGVALEHAAERIGGGFGAEASSWLLEVGIEAEPCVGSGLSARLTVPGPASQNQVLADSLRAVPELAGVRVGGDDGRRRLWLLGPELESLRELATARHAELQRVPGVVAAAVHLDAPEPELRVEYEREQLAALGLSAAGVAAQLRFASDGVEVGALYEPGGEIIPIVLQVGEGGAAELDSLRALPLAGGEAPVRLDMVARLRQELAPTRVCRRDGRRGVMLSVAVSDGDWSRIEGTLPPGYAWVWAEAARR